MQEQKEKEQKGRPIMGGLALFIEQIAVGSGAGQIENQITVMLLIDQKPVWRNVAFPAAGEIST